MAYFVNRCAIQKGNLQVILDHLMLTTLNSMILPTTGCRGAGDGHLMFALIHNMG